VRASPPDVRTPGGLILLPAVFILSDVRLSQESPNPHCKKGRSVGCGKERGSSTPSPARPPHRARSSGGREVLSMPPAISQPAPALVLPPMAFVLSDSQRLLFDSQQAGRRLSAIDSSLFLRLGD
jgi:hypothetical protein